MSVGAIPGGNIIGAGVGGSTLIGVYSAATGASIDCVNRNQSGLTGLLFQGDFDVYEFEFINMQPGTSNVDMWLRVSTNGGISFDSANNYCTSLIAYVTGGSSGSGATYAAPTSRWMLRNFNEVITSSIVCGDLKIYNPLSSTTFKMGRGKLGFTNLTPDLGSVDQTHLYKSNTPFNAVQCLMSVGTITGTILVYGKTKSSSILSIGGFLDGNKVGVIPLGTPPVLPSAGAVQLYADYLPSTLTIIPNMTSNTAPSGVASVSTEYAVANTAYVPMKATMGDAAGGWLTNGAALPQWIEYQFAAPTKIYGYGFMPWYVDNYPGRTPKSWQFQGYNGATWDVLDTQTNFSLFSSSASNIYKIVIAPVTYTRFRMYITANNGNAYTGLGGFLIYGAGPVGLYTMDSLGKVRPVT